jgi:hypothetical protein
MIVHQVYAYIWNETVQNVVVCDNYQLANDIAKGCYGNDAFAVDCLQYPCQIGDKYVDGRFYRVPDATENGVLIAKPMDTTPVDVSKLVEIEYVSTQEQEVATLKAQNAILATATSFIINTFTDEQAIMVADLYPLWSGESVKYEVGERIKDENYILYKVITAHTSQPDWKPSVSPSLFAKVLVENPNEVTEWKQPDSTNGYDKDIVVLHNGKEWKSLVNGNIWEPGVVGTETLWEEVIK